MTQEMTTGILMQLVTRSPLFLTWTVAVVFALVRWKKHPAVSALVLIAVAVFFVQAIVAAWAAFLPVSLSRAGRSHAEVGVIMSVYGWATTFVSTACWALVVAAIFGWRSEPAPR
jgi:hypothetical protein